MKNNLKKNIFNLHRNQKNFSLFSSNSLEFFTKPVGQFEGEKRKRNQAYLALDYILGRITYFDFFSQDAFTIAKYAKFGAQSFGKKSVTSEFFLLPFFQYESKLSILLQKYGINEKSIGNFLDSETKKTENNFFSKFLTSITEFRETKMLESISFDKTLNYSYESNSIFEKAAENALLRFKTPVITSEILFVTMMEEKNSQVGKIIKKILSNPTQWYLLRYRLIKRLHNQESRIRNDISKNQHYFAYLLKTQLTDSDFEKLLERNELNKGVSVFRNTLVSEALELNIFSLLLKEIKNSIRLTSTRKYSS